MYDSNKIAPIALAYQGILSSACPVESVLRVAARAKRAI